MRLLLVRHAQSVNNVAAREERSRTDISQAEIQENFERRRVEDPGLSELGTRQAVALAESLSDDEELAAYDDGSVCVYCSPMQRTILTARPLLRAFPAWNGVIEERIFEVGGLFSRRADGTETAGAGASPEELTSRFGPQFELSAALCSQSMQGRGWNALDHRETKEEAVARAKGVATWVKELERKGSPLVVLVIHGDLLGYLLRELLGSDARFLHFNTATTALELHNGRWTMLHQNRCGHLSGEDRTGAEMLAVVS